MERPSSCDTGHYARLATKGSVQQSSVDRPVYSEHARSCWDPVPGPGTPVPGPGTRCSVQPNTPGKQGTVTTSGRPITPGKPGSTSNRVIRSDQSTLVKKLNWKRLTSVWTSLSFLFFIHRADRCNLNIMFMNNQATCLICRLNICQSILKSLRLYNL